MSFFSLKMRCFLFVWGLVMLFLSAVATYAGISSVLGYISFPPVVVYSTGMVALFFSFFIVLPLSLAGFYSSLKGVRLPEHESRLLFKLFMGVFVFSVLFSFSFKLFYVSMLRNNDYIVCKGIPSGWMPGMATRYAINDVLCHKS